MDLANICRICLESNSPTYDIFSSYSSKTNTLYYEMLIDSTKLKPFQGDGLPKLICKECSRQLKRTYNFNIQCVENDKKLRSYLEKCSTTGSEDIGDHATMNYIKHENLDNKVKNEDQEMQYDGEKSKQEDIKLEPNFSDDEENACWDDEDISIKDNTVSDKKVCLKNMHSNSKSKETTKQKSTKKKGRKKTVFMEQQLRKLTENNLHQCDICGKLLSTKSNLKAHKISHTDLRPYQCTQCPASFRGHSALFQHKRVHTGETPYHCEYCPKQFSRRTGLVNHIRMHTGVKQYGCEICLKTFVQSAQLSIHMKRHMGEKSFLCQDCGKGFAIKADLKVHQRTHNGEKPYSCHMCTKTFATSGNLSIHIRIHNKEVRYNCKECQRGFVTCSAYNVHLKRHKGQRDYHCECGKTFYTSSALKQHKVVHTGEKKYQCKICDRKFTQTSHLSRHFKRDHVKPNAPVPSSEHYKLVLGQNPEKPFYGLTDQGNEESIKIEKSTLNINIENKEGHNNPNEVYILP